MSWSAMPVPDFELIETFRYEPACGFLRLDLHLQRMAASAAALGFRFSEADIRKELAAYAGGEQVLRMRVSLQPDGTVTLITAPYQPLPAATVWRLGIAQTRLRSAEPLLRHKTTRRQHYDQARAEYLAEQANEVLLLNEHDEICEGTITSVFADMGDGRLLTPPLQCGLLNGVLRQELLAGNIAQTMRLSLPDLQQARQLFVGNSLRGLIMAQLLPLS